MALVFFTKLADSDTAEIIEDLGDTSGESVAARYVADFDAVYRRLVLFPESGAPRPKLGKQARICIVLPSLISTSIWHRRTP